MSKLHLDASVTASTFQGKIKKRNDPAIVVCIGYLPGDGQKPLPQLNYARLPASIRPEGHGAAVHDRLIVERISWLLVSTVTHPDRIGWLMWAH